MSAAPTPAEDWRSRLKKLVGRGDGFLILVHGATSLEPVSEELQPQRIRSVGDTERHWFWPRRRHRPPPTPHVTARYAVAGQPLLPLLLDAYVTDLDRLDHGRDPVGELRFPSRKHRRDYLTRTGRLSIPQPHVDGKVEMMVPAIELMVPRHSDGAVLVLLAELEPDTADKDDWGTMLDVVPSKLPARVGIAVSDPDQRLWRPPAGADAVLDFDASADPEFQRPKRGDRPLRAGLGIEPWHGHEPNEDGEPAVNGDGATSSAGNREVAPNGVGDA